MSMQSTLAKLVAFFIFCTHGEALAQYSGSYSSYKERVNRLEQQQRQQTLNEYRQQGRTYAPETGTNLGNGGNSWTNLGTSGGYR